MKSQAYIAEIINRQVISVEARHSFADECTLGKDMLQKYMENIATVTKQLSQTGYPCYNEKAFKGQGTCCKQRGIKLAVLQSRMFPSGTLAYPLGHCDPRGIRQGPTDAGIQGQSQRS